MNEKHFKIADIPEQFRPKFSVGDKVIVEEQKGIVTEIKYEICTAFPDTVFGPYYRVSLGDWQDPGDDIGWYWEKSLHF